MSGKFCLNRKIFIQFLCLFISCSSWADILPESTESDEEKMGPLQIKSRAVKPSAACIINGGDIEIDSQRENIGIGEIIMFWVVGKPKGVVNEIQWHVDESQFDLSNSSPLKGLVIYLAARSDLRTDTVATVSATTTEGLTTPPKSVNIKIPKSLTGKEHVPDPIALRSYGRNVNPYSPIPPGEHGVRGAIEVTLAPLDVNFENVKLIERDDGFEWEGKNNAVPMPVLAGGHPASDVNKAIKIEPKNVFYDYVAERSNDSIPVILDNIKRDGRNPQKFWWNCSFRVHVGPGGPDSKDQDTVQLLPNPVKQIFTITAFPADIATEASIEKFGVIISRKESAIR